MQVHVYKLVEYYIVLVIIDRYVFGAHGSWLLIGTHLFPIINIEGFIRVKILRIAGIWDELVMEKREG